jgi:phosphoglycerate dehydrogenase-like enzyme
MIEALQGGRIAGAALDVFETEPLPADSILRTLPNVLLSPHVAGQTSDSMRAVAIAAADAILDVIAGRTPANIYNAEALAHRKRAS